LDFADIETVMSEKGKAMMGTGEGSGEDRAIKAAEAAIANPLLDQNSMCGACGVLINITGGKDMTLYEVDSAANRIREEVGDSEANIIFGSTFNPELEGSIRVSVVATGIEQNEMNFIKNKEAVVEVVEDEIENVESGSIDIDSHEPQSYNEYEGKITESEAEIQAKLEQLVRQTEWNKSEQMAALEKSNTSEPVAKPKKQSLLKRMWNSLKASDVSQQETNNYNNRQDTMPPSIHEGKADVKELPSFIRKDR